MPVVSTQHNIKFCYNASCTFLKKHNSAKRLFNSNKISPEEMAIDLTISIFKQNGKSSIISNLANLEDQIEVEFELLKIIKKRVNEVVDFELLKYDLITIEEYSELQLK